MNIDFTIDNVRNPAYAENGDIDLEFDHPDFGWIPYTINVDDPDSTINNDALKSVVDKIGIKEYIAPEIPPEGGEASDIIGSL